MRIKIKRINLNKERIMIYKKVGNPGKKRMLIEIDELDLKKKIV